MKKQKFFVPELKAKVRTLEAIFGEKFMRTEINPRTVDKWLREEKPSPYITTLKKYFKAAGMNESDMIQPKEEFSEKVLEIYENTIGSNDVRYTAEDIVSLYNSFLGQRTEQKALLGQTLKAMQIETIKNDYIYLKGFYHMYHFWKGSEKEAGMIRRNLIEIYDLDKDRGLMNCRIMISPMKNLKKEDWWIYEGWIFNIKNKLFFLYECVKGMLPEIVTLNVFKPSFWPEPDRFFLYGILSALSLNGIPSASRFVLKKIKQDDPTKENIGQLTPEELTKDIHGTDILEYISNNIQEKGDILNIKPVE